MREEFEELVLELENRLGQIDIVKGQTVFYGSSSFRLWENVNQQLESDDIVNLGFGGSTMEACDYYYERIVLPWNPSKLVLYSGDNDIGNGRLPHQIFDSFKSVYHKTRESFGDIPLTYVSIKPSPDRWDAVELIKETNELIKSFLIHDEHTHYIDIFEPMLDESNKVRSELFIEDGLHMNEAGYKIWSNVMKPAKGIIY